MTSIYLAGKIGFNDWRHDVVVGLRAAYTDGDFSDRRPWPTLKYAVRGDRGGALDYVGPFFVSCDHGCAHGGAYSGHGVDRAGHATSGGACIPTMGLHNDRSWVHQQCLDALHRTDIVFAWIDDPTAYGTLVEIGYATALGKIVIVDSPLDDDDFWFALKMHSRVNWVRNGAPSRSERPREAARAIADRYPPLESPIETSFWAEHLRQQRPELHGLVAQHSVLGGKYRLDFALPANKIGIELDGFAWHGDQDAFVKDRARQRILETAGWRIIRFAGKEVTDDVAGCITQAADFAAQTAR